MASNRESSAQEYEEYIEQHGIHALIKEVVAKLCQEKPANPYRFLRDYFDALDKVSTTYLVPVNSCLNVRAIPAA
jgi:hypothetical protein